jgi:hypothetical protein
MRDLSLGRAGSRPAALDRGTAHTAYPNLSRYRVAPDYPVNTALHAYSNGLGPRAASANTVLTQHYRVSPGYDSSANGSVYEPFWSFPGRP